MNQGLPLVLSLQPPCLLRVGLGQTGLVLTPDAALGEQGAQAKREKEGAEMLHAHRPGLCPLSGAESGGCSPLERMLCRTAYPLILLNEHLRNMADFVLNILNPPEMGNIITTISRISKQTRKLSKPTQSPAGIQIREPEFEAGPFTQPCMASRSVKTGCLQGFHEYSKDPAPAPTRQWGATHSHSPKHSAAAFAAPFKPPLFLAGHSICLLFLT